MSKLIKRLIVIIIAFMLMISLKQSVLLATNENRFNINNSKFNIDKDSYANYSNLLCAEKAQDQGIGEFNTTSTIRRYYDNGWKVDITRNGKTETEDSDASIRLINNLMKILSYDQENSFNYVNTTRKDFDFKDTTQYDGKNIWIYLNCPRQVYTWHYLNENVTSLKSFGFPDNQGWLRYTKNTDPIADIKDGPSGNYDKVAEGTNFWKTNSSEINYIASFYHGTITNGESCEWWFRGTFPLSLYNTIITDDVQCAGTIKIIEKDDAQKMMIWDVERVDTPTIQLTFKKTDISGSNALGGAQIEITANDNVSMDKVTLESSSTDGKFGTIEVTPTENTGKFKLNIKETDAPGGYNRIYGGDPVVLTVEYYTDTGKIKSMSVNECSRNFTFNNSKATITLKDDSRIISNLNVYKKDASTEKGIDGVTFNMYFNNITSVKIGDDEYYVKSIRENCKIKEIDGNKYYYKKAANGLELLVPTKETVGSEDYKNRLYVKGLKTKTINKVAGRIKIDEIKAMSDTKTVYVTVTESVAKDGYGNLPESMRLALKYYNNTWNIEARDSNKLSKEGNWDLSNDNLSLTLFNKQQIDKLTILKTNAQNNVGLQGAKFNITISNVKSIKGYSANSDEKIILTNVETNSNGNIVLENLVMADPAKNITIEVVESQAASGYKKIDGKMTITITRNVDSYTIVKTKESTVLDSEFTAGTETVSGHEIALGIKNIPNLSGLNLSKKDFSTQKGVANAEFKVEFENVKFVGATSATNGKVTITTKTDSNGNFVNAIENIEILDPTKNIVVKVTETAAPIEHKQIDGTIRFEVKLTGSTYSIENVTKSETILDEEFNSANVKLENNAIALNINNIPNIKELALNKTEYKQNTAVAGAEFKIEISNVESVGTRTANNGTVEITTTTDSKGNFKDKIEYIETLDTNNPITIKVTEKKAPVGYKRLEGTIEFQVNLVKGYYQIDTVTIPDSVLSQEFTGEKLSLNNYEVSLNIQDVPVMNLGGVVWEDTQTGIKEVQGPDGKYNNGEKGISGVPVQVYKSNGEKVTQDMYGNALMTKTASEGAKLTYKLHNGTTDTITLKEGEYIFPNLEKGADYYVEFTYDGINYKTVQLSGNIYSTTNPKESKVEEVNRNAFNAKFTTISDSTTADSKEEGKSYATASSLGENLSYEPSDEKNGVKISKLITTEDGKVLPNYQMKAKTKNYLKQASDWKDTWTNDGKVNRNSYALDINCGLTYRFFDLSIFTDIENAELTINGKSTTYDYNQILDGELTDRGLDSLSNENVSKGVADKNGIEYNLYLYYSDYYYRISDYLMEGEGAIENNTVKDEENDNQVIKGNVNEDQELRAFVTYKVIIKNQSTIDSAKVNELAYYYDENYKYVKTTNANGEELTAVRFNDDATIPAIAGKKAARVSGFAQELSQSKDYRQELYFTFEVKKSEDGTRSLPKDVECANIVEILSYSTAEGLVDNDSAPGNVVAFGYEDDTDEAQGINISLRDEAREISGTVFEDLNKDNDSKPVNDVIVQLIEVKQINGKYYEYIWQETRSGSEYVKKLSNDGSQITEVKYSEDTPDGEYTFTDFIPGNYIVRYIYGDGTTYDITPNVQKYNGQDYQSTKDPNYKAQWHNTAGYTADENGKYPSVARDNEARRLEVMAYSTIIDANLGATLESLNKEFAELTDAEKEKLEAYYQVFLADTAYNGFIEGKYKEYKGLDSTFSINTAGYEQQYELLKYYVSQKTWMAAETSRINIPVDANNKATPDSSTTVPYKDHKNKTVPITFENTNFGLALRPQNKLILEKHITGLKITPNGTGVQPIVDAKATISDIVNGINVKLDGIKTGLTAIKSVRDNRGFWKVETDIEELAQGAQLEVEYTYVVRNESDIDYLSSTLVEQYQRDALGYANYLKDLKKSVKAIMRTGQYAYSDSNTIGGYLGQFYYTGNKAGTDKLVSARAETLKESLNEQLAKQQTVGDYFNAREFTDGDVKTYIDRDGNDVSSGKEILTVIESKDPTKFLIRKAGPDYTENDTDWTKTAKITTVLSAVTNGEIGGNYPSYIAEIIRYSNAAGRRNMEVEPENLSYVHSEDTTITMNSGRNEEDEFWGESIIISKPTGEDKQTGVQIAIITTFSVAILGLGIVLIKKFVLKK